jgi:hypothetical protein
MTAKRKIFATSGGDSDTSKHIEIAVKRKRFTTIHPSGGDSDTSIHVEIAEKRR